MCVCYLKMVVNKIVIGIVRDNCMCSEVPMHPPMHLGEVKP